MRRIGLAALLAVSVGCGSSWRASAQDASSASGSSGSTGSGGFPAPAGNPLEGLFTPQPGFPTAQTTPNPQPQLPAGANLNNPVGALFNIQPAFPNAQTPNYATPDAPKGTGNHLEGLFTGQPQTVTPQTQLNPQPQPKYGIPGFKEMNDPNYVPPAPGTGAGGAQDALGGPADDSKDKDSKDKDSKDKDSKDKDSKDKDAKAKDSKDKDGKAKDAKDKDSKDKDAKNKDSKDKDSKDKDAKSKDAKGKDSNDKESKGKDSDVKGKDADAKDKDGDDAKEKEAKEKAAKDAEFKAIAARQYSPVQYAALLAQTGDYQQAMKILSAYLLTQPTNAQGHYLAAVVLVGLRNYHMAADEYNLVLQLAPGTKLGGLAIDGLHKLNAPIRMPKISLPPLQQKPTAKPNH